MLQEKQVLREEMRVAFEGAVGQLSGTNDNYYLYMYLYQIDNTITYR
jgi:hypothetical protein